MSSVQLYATSDYAERTMTISYRYSYAGKAINMTAFINLTYDFRMEYTSRTTTGSAVEAKFRVENPEATIKFEIGLSNYNISQDKNISGTLILVGGLSFRLGQGVIEPFRIFGESFIIITSGDSETQAPSRLAIIGSIQSLVNIIKGSITIYGDAIYGKTNMTMEEYMWTSDNLSLTQKFEPKNPGNITIIAEPYIEIVPPTLSVENLTIYTESGETFQIPLVQYSQNITLKTLLTTKQAGKSEEYLFEKIQEII